MKQEHSPKHVKWIECKSDDEEERREKSSIVPVSVTTKREPHTASEERNES